MFTLSKGPNLVDDISSLANTRSELSDLPKQIEFEIQIQIAPPPLRCILRTAPVYFAATPSTTSAMEVNEEWKLYNEEGFVFKRAKRSRISDSEEASEPAEPELNPAAEERNRRIRKKRTLVKLKRKYQSEMEQWEVLSNSFSAMQEKAAGYERVNARETTSSQDSEHGGEEDAPETASFMLDELLSMAETQEAIINDVSNLCEVAENLCRVEQEEEEESLFDLAVWCSPRSLMASLCAD